LLDLILTSKEGLTGVVKIKGSGGCSDHEVLEFPILRAGRRVKSKLTTLAFRREDFGLDKDVFGGVPWDKVLEEREAQESWLVFKDHLERAPSQQIQSQAKNAGRPAWVKKWLLAIFKHKKEAYTGWGQGWVTWKEYRNIVQASRDEARSAKAQKEFKVAKDIKQAGLLYRGDKKKTRENGILLLSEAGERVTQDMEKAEVLNAFFALVFTGKTSFQESEGPGSVNTW